jgi:isopentenyl-diphosphate delta-isomerase
MSKVTQASKRKSEHLKINLERDVNSGISSGFERFRFVHEALPDLNLDDILTTTQLFGRTLNAPILISSMTGGTADAEKINATLAEAAQATKIAMGVGSQRVAIEDPSLSKSFQIRKQAPDILLFANLGAIQLNYGFDLESCKRAVEMIEADALILHLNALQEALQPEGETAFKGLLSKIETVCESLDVPVIAKEVGWGFSVGTVKRLIDAGIAAIDVAGAGGTSWSQVEMHRAATGTQAALAAEFIDWGIPTADALEQLHSAFPDLPLIASGGLRSGMDIAKSIALGAALAGMAGSFLKAATKSTEAVLEHINMLSQTLQITMFATGCNSLEGLSLVIEPIE